MTVVIEKAGGAPLGTPLAGPIAASGASALELRDTMRSMSVQHEVEPLHGELDGVATGALLGDVHLAFVRYGAPTRVVAEPTGMRVCWTVPLGPMLVGRGAGPLELMTEGFVLSPGESTTMVPCPKLGAVVVTTSEQRLSRQLAKLTGQPSVPRLVVQTGTGRPEARGLIDSAWQHAARLLRAAPVGWVGQREALEDLLLTALLTELPSNATQIEAELTSDRGPSRIHARRAAEWLEAHFTEPITLTDWAAGVGISPRHLQKVVHETYDCSPTDLLIGRRLDRARELLATSPGERTVASIAHEVGWTHLGRFAARYRARFGTLPSQVQS